MGISLSHSHSLWALRQAHNIAYEAGREADGAFQNRKSLAYERRRRICNQIRSRVTYIYGALSCVYSRLDVQRRGALGARLIMLSVLFAPCNLPPAPISAVFFSFSGNPSADKDDAYAFFLAPVADPQLPSL